MALLSLSEILTFEVTKALEGQASAIKEKIIQDAVKQFEKEIRQAVGDVAVNVAKYYSVQVVGSELVIRVRIDSQ